ncbi:MAG: hypothetical protein M3Q56_00325 [Bacteroidota bacterium]|nr:hypothetical protein [Bacteroidota bacterium]
MLITTEDLDKTIAEFDSNPNFVDKAFDQLEKDNQLMLDILLGSYSELLTEEELDYLVFLFGVLYFSYAKKGTIQNFTEIQINNTEESTWQLINQDKDFGKCIDRFFETSEEKDVLEFIELSIGPVDDSEIKISDEGRITMLAVLMSELLLLQMQ